MTPDALRLGRADPFRARPVGPPADTPPAGPPTDRLPGPLTAVRPGGRADEAARLTAALGRLPADERLAVELRYRHARPLAEVAAALGCPPAAAAGLLRRGTAALHLALADAGP